MTKNNSGTFHMLAKSAPALLAGAAALMLTSCAYVKPLEQNRTAMAPKPAQEPVRPAPAPKAPAKPHALYEWNGDGRIVSRIEISVDEQKARFYDGSEEIGWTTVASGVKKHPTPVGTFAVLEKAVEKESNLYGKIYDKNGKVVVRDAKLGRDPIPPGGRFEGAKMPYFLRLTGDGIGMHAGPIPRPGRRASHGCIRMPSAFAPILYGQVGLGASVQVRGNGPTYAAYLAQTRAEAAKLAASRAKTAKAKAAEVVANTQPPAAGQSQGSASPPATTGAAANAENHAPAPVDGETQPAAVTESPTTPTSTVSETPKPATDPTPPPATPVAPPTGSESLPTAARQAPPPQREG
jgi:lipoprotein-anchoring transpeptidase ErfK/SrfK